MSFRVNAVEYATAPNRSGSRRSKKNQICTAFYEYGRCSFGNSCAHAHSYTELTQSSRANLLASVTVEKIPIHFLGDMESSGQRARGNHNHHHHERVSSHVNNNNNHWRETDTTSSRTSNSGSSNRFVKSNRRSNTEGNFSLRLPKRCSYPHQNITGTYYTVLGVDPHATHEQIVAQYTLWRKEGFRRMRQIDPTNVEAVDSLITEARNVLGHPALRIEYDETVRVATKSLTHTGSFASSHPFGEFSSLTSSMTETSNPDLHLFLSNNLAESSIW